MKAVLATIIASLIAAPVAFAEGDYYEGASRIASSQTNAVDQMSTGSIDRGSQAVPTRRADTGDYYEGASRN